jgi:DNA-binding MarR family transcriptional regulator
MAQLLHTMDALALWHRILSRAMKELPNDLSSRQMAVMTTVYLTEPPHTIRSLAQDLNISKPAICRAIDSLSMMGLLKRKKDETDKRNVFVQRTISGSVFLSDLGDIILSEWATDKVLDTAEAA